METNLTNSTADQSRKKIIYIHRGRNRKSIEIGRLFTSTDYNFDYRGKNKFLLIIKSLVTSTEVPKAEIYFVEGSLCLNVAYFVKTLWARKSKIIVSVIDPTFDFENLPNISKWWIRKLFSRVNGIIAISRMVKKDARKVYSGKIELGHHYIIDTGRFLSIKPNHKSRKIVFVIERPIETGRTKGLDIAIKTFEIVKEKFTDAELLLVGSGTEFLRFKDKKIKCLGYRNVEEIYGDCSIALSPARYDAFNLAIAEASCSGVIPIISSKVGAKEFVEKVDNSLVIDSLNPQKYADKIVELWSEKLNIVEKKSKHLRKLASYYNKENCMNEFKLAWKKLI